MSKSWLLGIRNAKLGRNLFVDTDAEEVAKKFVHFVQLEREDDSWMEKPTGDRGG